jgi:diketogulonate reductase-like aldo/keto reductase
MEEIYKSGKVKAIGVSNWSVPYLEHLEKTWTIIPAVNQVCKTNEINNYNLTSTGGASSIQSSA